MLGLLRGILVTALSVVALVLVAPVVVLVAVWRAVGRCADALNRLQPSERRRVVPGATMHPDPELGWAFEPNLDCYSTPYELDPYHLQTCADGFPGRGRVQDAQVLVVGDSFASGNGVDVEQSYFGVGREGEPRIKPVSCTGYSMVQGSILLERLARQGLQGKLVVWLFCIRNDFADAFSPTMGVQWQPFARRVDEGWELAAEHGRDWKGDWMASAGRFRTARASDCAFADYYRPGPVQDKGLAAFEFLLKKAAAQVRQAGGRLVVYAVPPREVVLPAEARRRELERLQVWSEDFDAGSLDRRLRASCQAAQVDYVSGLERLTFSDYLLIADDHWNERGHRKFRAWALAEYQRQGASAALRAG